MPPPGARAIGRDVYFYDLRDLDTVLGGLILTPGVTNANFYSMISIVLIISGDYFLQNDNGESLPRDSEPLNPGNYFIIADGTVDINDESILTRTISQCTGTRVQEFKENVRARDGRCVITGLENIRAFQGFWIGFEASHIFPLAYEKYWKDHDFDRWISFPPQRGGMINSVQNGILLRNDIHQSFDYLDFSINPDDNYKIFCFQPDLFGIAGRCLDRRLLDDERRPVDELLRWHFQQAVLANMRGAAGEPAFDNDFPPGSDIMGDIISGPKAAERMEAELFGRFALHMDVGGL